MSRPEALSVLGSLVLGGAAALFLTLSYRSSPPVEPAPPAPVSAPVEAVPMPRPRPEIPAGKPTRQPKGKAIPVKKPLPRKQPVSPHVCSQISAGMAFAGRARVLAEGTARGHSLADVKKAIRACGF